MQHLPGPLENIRQKSIWKNNNHSIVEEFVTIPISCLPSSKVVLEASGQSLSFPSITDINQGTDGWGF